MVKHVLMIKLKEECKDKCNELVEVFRSMKGNVPQVLDVEAGADFLHSARSYDVCL